MGTPSFCRTRSSLNAAQPALRSTRPERRLLMVRNDRLRSSRRAKGGPRSCRAWLASPGLENAVDARNPCAVATVVQRVPRRSSSRSAPTRERTRAATSVVTTNVPVPSTLVARSIPIIRAAALDDSGTLAETVTEGAVVAADGAVKAGPPAAVGAGADPVTAAARHAKRTSTTKPVAKPTTAPRGAPRRRRRGPTDKDGKRKVSRSCRYQRVRASATPDRLRRR